MAEPSILEVYISHTVLLNEFDSKQLHRFVPVCNKLIKIKAASKRPILTAVSLTLLANYSKSLLSATFFIHVM